MLWANFLFFLRPGPLRQNIIIYYMMPTRKFSFQHQPVDRSHLYKHASPQTALQCSCAPGLRHLFAVFFFTQAQFLFGFPLNIHFSSLQEHVAQVFLHFWEMDELTVSSYFQQRLPGFLATHTQSLAGSLRNKYESSSKQSDVGDEVVGDVTTEGDFVASTISFIGAFVSRVGATVRTGAFDGLAVGSGVFGLGVGLGLDVGEVVVAVTTEGDFVGSTVSFVGAFVSRVGAPVRTGAFDGLAVGSGVFGLGVGLGLDVGDWVGSTVFFVGAFVSRVGAPVRTGAFDGLAVGSEVFGLGVGLGLGGGGGGTEPNMSSTSKEKLSKFSRLGSTSFILSFGTPNHPAMPLKTASQGVDGIIRPLPNVRGPSSVKSLGYSPRIFPPFTDPPNIR